MECVERAMETQEPVAEAWRTFVRDVLPRGTPAMTVENLRRSFFSGAMTVFSALTGAAGAEDEEFVAICQRMQAEFDAFIGGRLGDGTVN